MSYEAISYLCRDGLDKLPHIIALVSSEDCRVVFANRAMVDVLAGLGPPEDAVIGRQIREVLPDIGDTVADACLSTVRTGVSEELHDQVIGSAGNETYWHITLIPAISHDDRQGCFVWLLGIDTTCDKRLRDAISRSEAGFRAVFDHMPAPVFAYDISGRILLANPTCEQVYGFSQDELVGHSMFETIAQPGSRDATMAVIRRVFAGETVTNIEWSDRRRDGSIARVLTNATPVTDESDRVTMGLSMNVDITERKEAEERLRDLLTQVEAERHQFQTVVDNSPVGIALFDGVDLRVKWANPAWRRYLDQPLRDMDPVGKTLQDLVPGAEEYGLVENARTVVRTREPFVTSEMEYHGYARGATYWKIMVFPLPSPEDQPPDTISLVIEITDQVNLRKQLERERDELRRLKEDYQLLVENQTDLVVKVDPDGRFLFVSPSYCETFGRTAEDLLGKSFMPLVHHEDIARTDEAMRTVVEPPYRTYIEQRALTRNGWRWFAWADTAVVNGEGKVTAIIGVGRDITDRKRVEEELAEAHANAERRADEAEEGRATLQALMEYVPEAVVIVDTDLRVRESSKSTSEIIPRRPDEPVSERALESGPYGRVLSSDGQTPTPLEDLPLTRAVRTGAVSTNEEFVYQRRDGSKVPILASAGPIRDSAGNVTGGIVAFRDITAIKTARENTERQLHLLQQALLPSKIPPIGDEYRVATVYVPAFAGQEIGGDFYEVFRTETGDAGILIGDVSGKGIEAASLAATGRSVIHAYAYDMSQAGPALSHANSVLYDEHAAFMRFLTACLVIVQPDSGALCYSNGGHPPAAIRRADGPVGFLTFGQPPIGLVKTYAYEEAHDRIGPGDKIVLYTDGISEARRGQEFFGIEGVQRVLEEEGHLPAEGIVNALLNAALDWAHGNLRDDCAIVVVERLAG